MTDCHQLEVKRSSSEGTFKRLTFSIAALILEVLFFWKFFESSLENDSREDNYADREERAEKRAAVPQLTHSAVNGKQKHINDKQQQSSDDVGDLSSILLDESYLRKSSEICDDSLDTITEDEDEEAAVIREQVEQDGDLLLEEAENDDVFDETAKLNSRFSTSSGQQNLSFLSEGSTSLQAEIVDNGSSSSDRTSSVQSSPLPEEGECVKLNAAPPPATASRNLNLPLGSVVDNSKNKLTTLNNSQITPSADSQNQRKYTFVARAQARAVLSEDKSPTFQTDANPSEINVSFQIDKIVEEAVAEGENPYVTVARAMAKATSAAAEAAMRSLASNATTGDNDASNASSRPLQLVLTASCTLRADSSRFLRYAAQTPTSTGAVMGLYSPLTPQPRPI